MKTKQNVFSKLKFWIYQPIDGRTGPTILLRNEILHFTLLPQRKKLLILLVEIPLSKFNSISFQFNSLLLILLKLIRVSPQEPRTFINLKPNEWLEIEKNRFYECSQIKILSQV